MQPFSLTRADTVGQYLYVSDRTQNELIVYQLGNPKPVREQRLIKAGGVATDPQGNVYVANGTGGDVLEFAPGATHLMRTLDRGLRDPVNVAVAHDGSVYVADNASGTSNAVVKFAKNASYVIPTPEGAPAHGLAVDGNGNLFVEITGNRNSWPLSKIYCLALNEIYEYPAHAATSRRLVLTEQNWGLAASGNTLYFSDLCLGIIGQSGGPAYNGIGISASHQMVPVYITVSGSTLVVPEAGNGDDGSVVLQQIAPAVGETVIKDGLKGPVGAAIGP